MNPIAPNHSLAPVSLPHSSARYDRVLKLRKARYRLLSGSRISRGFNDKTPVLCFEDESAVNAYCRRFRVAEKGEKLWQHHGYYVDAHESETLKPAVALIGKLWLYGYEETGGMFCFYLDGPCNGDAGEPTFESLMEECAGYADSVTERAAEREREYNEKWQEARNLETEVENLQAERAELYQTAHGWIADLRGSSPSPALCGRLKAMLAEIRTKALDLADAITEKQSALALLPE